MRFQATFTNFAQNCAKLSLLLWGAILKMVLRHNQNRWGGQLLDTSNINHLLLKYGPKYFRAFSWQNFIGGSKTDIGQNTFFPLTQVWLGRF